MKTTVSEKAGFLFGACLQKDAEFEDKHPREHGGKFAPKGEMGAVAVPTEPPKFLKRVPSEIVPAVKSVLSKIPAHLKAGIVVDYDKTADRTVYLPQPGGGGKVLFGRDVNPGIAYASSDMDGKRVAQKGYSKFHDEDKSVMKVPNVGAHLAAQTVAHELGHHVWRKMTDEQQKEARDTMKKHGKTINTSAVGAYIQHYRERQIEGVGIVPTQAVIDDRISRERFAEVTRMKITGNPEYGKVPKPVRQLVDQALK